MSPVTINVNKGRYSWVFRAEDTDTGRVVAIKQMQEDLTPAERAFAHALFIREAALLSDLAHPGIPALFGHLQEAQPQTLVMEFVPGVTLELLLQQSMLTLAEVCDSGIQLCAILDYLHRQCSTIIHRDLKPANVLRRPDGSIVLVDFGIARRCTTTVSKTTASRWRSGQPTHRVCDTLVNLGTMGYAAPEQYGEAAQTTPRSDLFSLGVILHRMLSGEDPAAQAKRVRFLTLFRFVRLPDACIQNWPTSLPVLSRWTRSFGLATLPMCSKYSEPSPWTYTVFQGIAAHPSFSA